MPLHTTESAATNSALPLLSAIVDCFLVHAVIGYQPSLPRNHDAVPLTLSRPASPALSESPYVNTEPTRALFTASRLSVVGRTVMIPGFPRRSRRIDLMFLMSCRSHVQGLMRLSHCTTQVSSANPQQFSNKLSVHSLFACRHPLLICLTAFPTQCWSALERGHVELFQRAFHIRSINSEVVHLLRFCQGSSEVARWCCRHFAAFELQVSARFSEDFFDDLVRSSQQQVVHMEYE